MNRREAISKVAWILGGTVIGAELFADLACTPRPDKVNDLFDSDQVALLDEVAETILPATNTPGAKAAKVGQFMTVMVLDCYTPEDQKVFIKGISDLDEACKKENGKKFMDCDAKQRTAFLNRLDQEQKAYQKDKKPEDPNHYFTMMKQLTLLGFFTSEVGATKALRYVAIPGKYDGCTTYKKGDRAWAT
ncbi:gluconate 2-dehydrogenase subunit 3-like protein [Arcticibacter tournemirensis]|uniref:Gluconate 2-dehydrogenase subunit 3 family protein n=1 Tax=Arcticibacter tournemirensis TaxID=699437 RepID=A0A5M9HA19_9SPHI|nr:gluconate 2-dehydrogenase subunit 3 family protein [Arcticibacter tournemirensis]KAA8483792.1 gluconate 2-dehydrogenase subunit 3 family protein [Arcticibacter tournemirensis]TQM50002.1 gluconate 2-dehydrogenase subunit 3-like protein [Arcticibacter tournemirensis]